MPESPVHNSRLTRRAFVALSASAAAAAPSLVRAQAKPIGSLTLGWVKSTANLLAPVSVDNAIRYGLTINSANFNTAQDILTAMIAGQVDVGLLTPIHLIRAVDTDLGFVQIAGNARGGTGIVAASKLGLKKGDWGALKALAHTRQIKVASSRGSINEALAIAEFEKNGLDLTRDVSLVNIANFAEHVQALRSGDFDMIVSLEPVVSLAVTQGVGTLFSYPYDTAAGNLNTNFCASQKWLSTNGDKAQAFVNALRDSQRKLTSDSAFTFAAAVKLTGLNQDVLKMAFSNTTFDLRNGLPQMQALAKIAVAEHYVQKDVSAQLPSFVESRYLRAAGVPA